MKATAVLFDELGAPEVLYLEEVEIPEPGAGEVRVRVDAIGVNRGDVLVRSGGYYYDAVLPKSRLGTEAAGVVEAVGDAVAGFAVGDAVSMLAKPTDAGMSLYGVYGDRVVVPADRLIRRPADMDAVTGAALWMPALTAYGGLVEVGKLQPGDTVVVTAASSTVGLAAIQLADHLGATAIAVTRTGTKADALRAAGAAHVIASDDGGVVEQVHALTAGRGARLIFDAVGGPQLSELVLALSPDGMAIVYGWLDGQPTPLPMSWPINVYGYAVYHLLADPERFRRAEAFINRGVRAGPLAPVIDRTFDLGEVAAAHRYMETNEQGGKIVLTVEH
ncbi:2-haloacrylate reductase [Baekduia alba]|uniref:zinc-dependent alcohol dehydrogenase family protein n=1 Tax=Baekduia alba TaxID=2997333 RepID=UPI0023410B32|nr:zinc-dependent alcohol dehydrogenase family protein [Baekduia alba]WCB95452.1 2-haloacrylate reductase [Baekduia alba]